MTTAVQPFTGNYSADTVHSTFGFAVEYAGAGRFRGSFADVRAELTAVDAGLALEGAARADSISIQEPPQFRAHVLGPEFFDAENHPEVGFRSTKIDLAGDGSARLEGELAIAGKTRPVVATGTWSEPIETAAGVRAALALEAVIDRRDFGFDWQMALPGGGDALAYDVTLEVSLALVAQEAG
jgi:polyisoprenoid-binding protein YceI